MLNGASAYFYEKDRLQSFQCWPYSEPSPCNVKNLAEAGFYWKGTAQEPDTAACFMCGKVLHGWEETDDPWLEHKKHAPQCVFVKNGKQEDSYTVNEFVDLMQAYCRAQQEQNKRNYLKLKHKLEEMRDGFSRTTN